MKAQLVIVGIIVIIIVGVVGYFVWQGSMNQQVATTASTNVVDPATIPVSTTTTNVGVPPANTKMKSAPTVETDSDVSSTTKSSTAVSGSITPNGAQTSYWFAYGTTQSLGQETKLQKIGSGNDPLPAPGTIKGLNANTQYYFALVAMNSQGTATGTVENFMTNAKSPSSGPTGDVPTVQTYTAVNIDNNSATLVGLVNPDHSRTIYWFEYGTTPDMGSVTKLKSVGTGGKDTGVRGNLSGLQPNTTYYYRLNANNAFGTTLGAVLVFKTDKQGNAN